MIDYEIDWTRVHHWTDLQKIMKAMELVIREPKDKPMEKFDPIRHLLIEKTDD